MKLFSIFIVLIFTSLFSNANTEYPITYIDGYESTVTDEVQLAVPNGTEYSYEKVAGITVHRFVLDEIAY